MQGLGELLVLRAAGAELTVHRNQNFEIARTSVLRPNAQTLTLHTRRSSAHSLARSLTAHAHSICSLDAAPVLIPTPSQQLSALRASHVMAPADCHRCDRLTTLQRDIGRHLRPHSVDSLRSPCGAVTWDAECGVSINCRWCVCACVVCCVLCAYPK